MINKQTKMILGLAAVGVAGYFVFKSMKPKTQNFVRRNRFGNDIIPKCPNCPNGQCTEIIPRTEATIAAGIAGQTAIKPCEPKTTQTQTTESTLTTASRNF
jgi:hypothetical protein